MAVNSFREDEQLNAAEKSKIILRLVRYLSKHIWGIIIVLISLGITVVIRLVNPLIIEEAIDNYIANKNSKKFHYPSCKSVDQMSEKNKWYYNGSRDTLIEQGYVPCKNCNP